MMRIIKLFAFAIAIAIAVIAGIRDGGLSVKASAANYTWSYSATNFYSENTIIYSFSGLDVSADYVWYIQLTDENGVPIDQLGFRASSGATMYTWFFGGGAGNTNWPENYTGPMRVVDNYGNVLGQHFIAPTPGDDWVSTSGVTDEGLKQAPGVPKHAGDCRAAPYWDINPDGYHHSFTACTQQVTSDSYFLLHYRLDLAEYGDGDTFEFYRVGESAAIATFALDEIIDNNFGNYGGGLSEVETRSFVVVNTSNDLLGFVDYDKSDSDFSTVAGNPHRASIIGAFDYGAYNCVRLEHDTVPNTVVSDCESILLVSRDQPTNRFEGSEWSIRAKFNPIAGGNDQVAILRGITEEIWDSYNGAYAVIDQIEGTVDTTVYAFNTYIESEYTTSQVVVPDNQVFLYWSVTPNALNSLSMSVADARFISVDSYGITVTETASSGWSELINSLGFGSDKGKLFVFILLELIGVGLTAAFMPRNFLLQLIIFTFIGGNLWALGLFTQDLKVLFAIVTLILWIIYFAYMKINTSDTTAAM